MRFMQRSKDSLAKWLSAILPVVIVGLVGLFAVTVIRDYGRETAAARQTLLEKGSVLIRALESGSRVGMGMRMHHAQQQALLEEMAGQPGVRWFAVTDEQGTIVMHSNSGMVGNSFIPRRKCSSYILEMKKRGGGSIAQTASLFWKFIASFNRCLLLECTGCAICSSMPQHHKQFSSLSTPVIL